MFDADGEGALIHFWECFGVTDIAAGGHADAASLVPLLTVRVSETLGRAVREWQ